MNENQNGCVLSDKCLLIVGKYVLNGMLLVFGVGLELVSGSYWRGFSLD